MCESLSRAACTDTNDEMRRILHTVDKGKGNTLTRSCRGPMSLQKGHSGPVPRRYHLSLREKIRPILVRWLRLLRPPRTGPRAANLLLQHSATRRRLRPVRDALRRALSPLLLWLTRGLPPRVACDGVLGLLDGPATDNPKHSPCPPHRRPPAQGRPTQPYGKCPTNKVNRCLFDS